METSSYEASSIMCLPYSGKLSRKKTLVENAIFANKTFLNCSLVLPKNSTLPNFVKTFTNSHKTLKFAKVFSLESFPQYMVFYNQALPYM